MMDSIKDDEVPYFVKKNMLRMGSEMATEGIPTKKCTRISGTRYLKDL